MPTVYLPTNFQNYHTDMFRNVQRELAICGDIKPVWLHGRKRRGCRPDPRRIRDLCPDASSHQGMWSKKGILILRLRQAYQNIWAGIPGEATF